ncbi:hypothetical protein GFS60_04188 [Rhodococcus sp. WAY2]|nr:hypothetical protein GFS60_04188 [Rhodococcus sp. WAY2]
MTRTRTGRFLRFGGCHCLSLRKRIPDRISARGESAETEGGGSRRSSPVSGMGTSRSPGHTRTQPRPALTRTDTLFTSIRPAEHRRPENGRFGTDGY